MRLMFLFIRGGGAISWAVMFSFLLFGFSTGPVYASDEPATIGRITALKGDVLIERDKQAIVAERDGKVFLQDSIRTKESARIKMRFIDDSALTLSENSHLNIREYFHDKAEKEGHSIFELLDGQLRTLVGSNDLEIHTPTAVAAARGTFFFVRVIYLNNVAVTEISLLEGVLEVSSKEGKAGGPLILEPGMTTTITQNELPTPPEPIKDSQLKELLDCSSMSQ